MSACRQEFWMRHPGLVWSNPEAGDAVYIRAALVRPWFSLLLEIALEFGLERLHQEWDYLKEEPTKEVMRAQGSVERILHNIEEGFALAAA